MVPKCSIIATIKWIGGFLVGVVVLVGSSRPFCFFQRCGLGGFIETLLLFGLGKML